ncbi:TIGR02186 family protein [Sphingomonas solaris]|uniref:TIGR02186 family protein n=1 Tax=Alterirhizorhabdus solaris TaxID=2529389 RepID=UPI001EF0AA72|nr:TIGR02186 family protein [Sphingomonas solaris]
MKRLPLLMLLALLLGGAAKPRLVPDVSQRRIDIIYSFTGAELLLFGAIVYPGGVVPKRPADVVVVIKGPTESVLLREKQKVAGIWLNAESGRFRSVPSFYAVAASRPLGQVVDGRTAAIYEFGVDNIQLSPASSAPPDEQKRFEQGLVDLKNRMGLYVEVPHGVEVSEGVLYRARIRLPARVPVGDYTAETFLVQDGRVIAAAVREIAVYRSGFERIVASFAERHALAYGLVAVALSVLLGWAAGAIFGRKRA